MRSKRRRSKKRRQRVWTPPTDWSSWLWGLLALNVLVGLFFSPVTGLRSVRVVGAPEFDQTRIRDFMRELAGVPFKRLDERRIQTHALENLAVESAEYRANLFGRGVLELVYKRPVARIEGSDGLYLSSRGSVFPLPDAPRISMSVTLPYSVGERNLSVFSSSRLGVAAWMCENIEKRLSDESWGLKVLRAGYVELVTKRGGTVKLGSFEDAEAKLQVLEELLRKDPNLLGQVKALNLSSPLNPVTE